MNKSTFMLSDSKHTHTLNAGIHLKAVYLVISTKGVIDNVKSFKQ